MAKLPPKQEAGNDQEWLNTYADMVTLLLTFFVLLFACSNMDETKVQYIFQAFQIRGRYVNTIVTKPNETTTDENGGNSEDPNGIAGDGADVQSFDELYSYLSDVIDTMNLGEDVSIEQGASHITIRFNDTVFFDGDSYRLKDEGKEVLNGFIPALRAMNPLIQSVIVTGHTAYVPRPTMSVFMLSSMRAVSVEEYLALKNTVDESKYACHGYGPNKPIADNDTADGKRKNRRVELIIQRNQADLDLNDVSVLRDMLEHQFNITNDKYNPQDPPPVPPDTLPEGSADRIVAEIEDKLSGSGGSSGFYGPGGIDLGDFKVQVEEASSE